MSRWITPALLISVVTAVVRRLAHRRPRPPPTGTSDGPRGRNVLAAVDPEFPAAKRQVTIIAVMALTLLAVGIGLLAV